MLYIKFIRYSCFKIIKVVIAKHGGDRESMNRGEKDIKGNFKATYTASDMQILSLVEEERIQVDSCRDTDGSSQTFGTLSINIQLTCSIEFSRSALLLRSVHLLLCITICPVNKNICNVTIKTLELLLPGSLVLNDICYCVKVSWFQFLFLCVLVLFVL
uniref:Uncharacterized protein n=1 Tax=Oryzias latipes TaxID=8090 RepID=A0A3B3HUY8_ORYLA